MVDDPYSSPRYLSRAYPMNYDPSIIPWMVADGNWEFLRRPLEKVIYFRRHVSGLKNTTSEGWQHVGFSS